MKTILLSLPIALFLACPAGAYETFIPTGPGYSTDVDSVPEINSDIDQLKAGADIIESDIYRRAREEHQNDSYLKRFFSEPENAGSDFSVDY